MNEPKRIPITNRKTGRVRYSEPSLQQKPRNALPLATDDHQKDAVSNFSNVQAIAVQTSEDKKEVESLIFDQPAERRATPKPKVEIETFGQFITHAYGMKGRKVALKPKVERAIAQDPKLTFDEMERIAHLVKEDILLAVPRQLLLAARAVQGFPFLRAALRAFVRDILLGHPLFRQPGVEAAVRNLDEAENPADTLKLITASDKKLLSAELADSIKPTEFEQLRLNAVNCMAVWLADVKGLSVLATTDALFIALWRPMASVLANDTAKFRALTEIDELAGVGLVCDEYRRQAADKHAQADGAAREVSSLRERSYNLEGELLQAREALEHKEVAMAEMAATHADALAGLKTRAETESIHLRDDLELLRTRVLRRLKADVDLLELGLEALRRPEPKVHVMMDSAERVTDALRREIKNLQGSE